ncbi:DUF6176 family protein [Tessaracoccus oleiagri]|uniref:Uncharacterized protein n=1 Tax=Tessaracoccus oleiagri TaxID=686624 RepID=A0A1G9HNY5_9ACTN|nr:DUF6176 family protein [Tessaracoccus oleiagri]SDL14681.1 hypothetical protein SAMN04488242_0437 [Tessaracoccus oleiagri]
MTEIPFRPTAGNPHPMPASVPEGLRLELGRAKIVPGMEREAEAWMRMLNERIDEGVATLAKERAPLQAAFFNREADGSLWIYYLSLVPEDGPAFDPEASDIDRAHAEYGGRVKMPGWEELQPKLLLVPDHIRDAMVRWSRGGGA